MIMDKIIKISDILEKEEKTLVILGTKPLRNTEDKVQ